MTSALCTVNSTATTDGVDIGPSATTTIVLADSAGVSTWEIECWSASGSMTVAQVNAARAIDSGTFTCTFTSGDAGDTYLFRSTVNQGLDVNGRTDSDLTATFGIFIPINGNRTGSVGETLEGSAAEGWSAKFNSLAFSAPAINEFSYGSVDTTDNSLTLLMSAEIPEGASAVIHYWITGHDFDNEEAVGYSRIICVRHDGSVLNYVGSPVADGTFEDAGLTGCDETPDLGLTNFFNVYVTGVTARNITWRGKMQVVTSELP